MVWSFRTLYCVVSWFGTLTLEAVCAFEHTITHNHISRIMLNSWSIAPAPDDDECEAICGMTGRGNRNTQEKTYPSAALSTTNPA
jgi:hypothetical protein